MTNCYTRSSFPIKSMQRPASHKLVPQKSKYSKSNLGRTQQNARNAMARCKLRKQGMKVPCYCTLWGLIIAHVGNKTRNGILYMFIKSNAPFGPRRLEHHQTTPVVQLWSFVVLSLVEFNWYGSSWCKVDVLYLCWKVARFNSQQWLCCSWLS